MRITVTTGGSRGDTQPFVALGVALQGRGHEVTIATHSVYEEFVRSEDLGFHEVFGDPEGDMRRLTGDGRAPGPVEFARRNRRNVERSVGPMVSDYLDACREAEAVIYSYPGFMGHFVGQELGLPVIGAFVEPFSEPTASFQSALVPEAPVLLSQVPFGAHLEAAYNRASHILTRQLFWQFLRAPANEALESRLGARRQPLRGPFKESAHDKVPAIYGFSPSVVPTPSEWGDHLSVTGFWFFDEAVSAERLGRWKPPEGLVEFLERPGKVVSIGLGSTIEPDTPTLTALVEDAVRAAGVRAVIIGGWSGLGEEQSGKGLDPQVFYRTEEVPYHWLFPKMDAIVHHGGAGASADAFRAGVPQVVVPSYHGQPFWGSLVRARGVGPEPLHRGRLTASRLARAIRIAVDDPSMRDSARNVGGQIKSEQGLAKAVSEIERVLGLGSV